MTKAELGLRMSSAEFTGWLQYADVEPFGPRQEEERAGQIAAVVANVNRDQKRRPQPFTPGDFLPSLQAAPVIVPLGEKLRAIFGSMRHKR